MLLESAAATSAPFYTDHKNGSITHYCDDPVQGTGDKVFAYYSASSEYSYNAPSDAEQPQFYSALEGATVTCTSLPDLLKITITGTDPNGLAISGLSLAGGLVAQTSPDDAGTLNGLMTFVFDELASFVPGLTPALKYVRSGSGLTTGSDSSSAWAQWKALGQTANAKGLYIGFRPAVNTSLKGTYKVRVTYHFEIWDTHYTCPFTCSHAVAGVDLTHDMEYCYKRCNPPASNNAQFISHNMPLSLSPGSSVPVTVVMKNTGQTTWWPLDRGSYIPSSCADCESWYRLGSQPSGDMIWGLKRADLSAPVSPGQTFTFQFTVTAPTTPGNYYWQWRMVQDHNSVNSVIEWFGQTTPNVLVCVGPSYSLTMSPTTGGTTNPASGASYNYPCGTTVTVSSSPNVGKRLGYWTLDGAQYFGPSISVSMTSSRTLKANFVAASDRVLVIEKDLSQEGTTTPAPGIYTYASGSSVQVTAYGSGDWRFGNWYLDQTIHTENPITVTMNSDHKLFVNFDYNPPPCPPPCPTSLPVAVGAPAHATTPGTVVGRDADAVDTPAGQKRAEGILEERAQLPSTQAEAKLRYVTTRPYWNEPQAKPKLD